MSTSSTSIIPGFFIACFIAVKIWGTSLAGWSWWWVFLPFWPLAWMVIHRMAL